MTFFSFENCWVYLKWLFNQKLQKSFTAKIFVAKVSLDKCPKCSRRQKAFSKKSTQVEWSLIKNQIPWKDSLRRFDFRKGASIKDVHTPGGRGVCQKCTKSVQGGGVFFELCMYTFLKTRAHQIFFVSKKSVQILRKKLRKKIAIACANMQK